MKAGLLYVVSLALFFWLLGFMRSVATHQFAGYDLSVIIDFSHRIRSGQIPGVDFINVLPPLMYLILKATRFLPDTWMRLIHASWLFALLSFSVAFICLVRLKKQSLFPLLIAAFFIPLMETGFLWYSYISQFAAICFFCSTMLYLRADDPSRADDRSKRAATALLFTSSALVSVAKQNVAAPLIAMAVLGSLFLAWREPENRRRYLVYPAITLSGGFLAWLVYSLWSGTTLRALLYIYWAVRGRALLDRTALDYIYHCNPHSCQGIAVLLAVFLAAQFTHRLKNRRITTAESFFCLGFLIVGLLPVFTDYDSKFNDISLPVFVMGWMLSRLETRGLKYAWCLVLALLLARAHTEGIMRTRLIYPFEPFAEIPASNTIHDRYFGTLYVGRTFFGVIQELEAGKPELKDKHVFFGNFLEFAYQILGESSPRGLPIWWHLGTSYALEDAGLVTKNFFEDRFDTVVFLKNQTFFSLPQPLLDQITRSYSSCGSYKFLDVRCRVENGCRGLKP